MANEAVGVVARDAAPQHVAHSNEERTGAGSRAQAPAQTPAQTLLRQLDGETLPARSHVHSNCFGIVPEDDAAPAQ